ncbi:MAG: hypothetical protein PVH18_02110 [Chloroflexota bacterium]|jgi:hypothetical protein
MKAENRILTALVALVVAAALAALALVVRPSLAGGQTTPALKAGALVAGAPGLVSYQGYLSGDEGAPLEGPVDLEFGIYPSMASDTAIWSEAQNNVPLADGYFNVFLGSTNPLTADHFASAERYLQVSVDDGSGAVILPRQRMASAPYALQASSAGQADSAPWTGLSGVPAGFADDNDGVEYELVVTVAKSGADFTSIQAAIDSITDASSDNRYLVWVGPGRYNERVTLKNYVYLQGVEQWETVIEYAAGSASYPPDTATLTLSGNSRVRRLTVLSYGTAVHNTAILAPDGAAHVLLDNIYVEARGTGEDNHGLVVMGSNTSLTINQAYIGASNGANSNTGLVLEDDVSVSLADSSIWGRGGSYSNGILNRGNMQANDITVEASGATINTIALSNQLGARATLRGGFFSGRDGSEIACGICNFDAHVSATGVESEGNSTVGTGYGFRNDSGTAELQGGRFHAGGNDTADAIAIYNNSYEIAFAPSLMVREVWASVGGSNNCYAMYNEDGGRAILVGGEYWAAVCNQNYGAYNTGTDSTLEINNALINSSGGFDNFFGLYAGANTTTNISNSELRGDDYALSSQAGSGHLQFVYLKGVLTGDASNMHCNAVSQGGTFYADSCPPEVP